MNPKNKVRATDHSLIKTREPELGAEERSTLSYLLKNGLLTRRQAVKWLMAMGIGVLASNTLVSQAGKVFAATPREVHCHGPSGWHIIGRLTEQLVNGASLVEVYYQETQSALLQMFNFCRPVSDNASYGEGLPVLEDPLVGLAV